MIDGQGQGKQGQLPISGGSIYVKELTRCSCTKETRLFFSSDCFCVPRLPLSCQEPNLSVPIPSTPSNLRIHVRAP